MAIITLITDWHEGDHYLSALKGKLMGLMPELQIIDISHQLPSFAYIKASFILRNCYRSFPKGTVHIVGVNSEATPANPHIAVLHDGQYFIGADNGIFGLMFHSKPDKIIEIEHTAITTFPEYDIFADAAVYLLKDGNIDKLGKLRSELFLPSPLLATFDESVINGSIIFIDSFSNAITNITREIFERVGKGRRFEVLVQSNYYKIKKINKLYNETPNGELLALFNSSGMLEIAINKGNAAELLSLSLNSTVRVKFYNADERDNLKLI